MHPGKPIACPMSVASPTAHRGCLLQATVRVIDQLLGRPNATAAPKPVDAAADE